MRHFPWAVPTLFLGLCLAADNPQPPFPGSDPPFGRPPFADTVNHAPEIRRWFGWQEVVIPKKTLPEPAPTPWLSSLKGRYGMLFLLPLVQLEEFEQWLEIIGSPPVSRGYHEFEGRLYEQWTVVLNPSRLIASLDSLGGKFPPSFYALLDLSEPSWKLDAAMAGRIPFPTEFVDEGSGKVCGGVAFYFDVGGSRREEILREYLPSQEFINFCEYAYREEYARLAELEEVEFVYLGVHKEPTRTKLHRPVSLKFAAPSEGRSRESYGASGKRIPEYTLPRSKSLIRPVPGR